MESPAAVVIGAGISGLAAARALARSGVAVQVLEAGDAPGGTFRTAEADGFRAELGPNTLQDSPELRELARAAGDSGDVGDTGCEDGLVPASPLAKKRYLVAGGQLVALPAAPPGILQTSLLSLAAKLRLATEPWRGRGPGPEETVAAFFRRRLGPETARLADAMVLGIYAGDPAELAVGYAFRRIHGMETEHGSLLKALRRTRGRPPGLVGFRDGLGAFAQCLTRGLSIETSWRVETVRREGEIFHGTAVREGERQEWEARRLVTALPAAATARILENLGSTRAIAALPHAPVAVVALGFPRDRIAHPLDGFGLLAPHAEGRRILGAIFTSTLFPATAPAGHALLTAMVGGRRAPERVDLDDAGLVQLVREELGELLGVRGEPVFQRVARWQPGIPQPTAAWAASSREADRLERYNAGLTVLGNWRHGVGVPDCIRAGWAVR
jgi:oxygen-dependent protoporphyrinogen oxidase